MVKSEIFGIVYDFWDRAFGVGKKNACRVSSVIVVCVCEVGYPATSSFFPRF